jgi:hypothetical protein
MLPCCSIPFIPRPLEYIGTGMWQGFIFTWPYQPRWVEPLMTNTGRESVSGRKRSGVQGGRLNPLFLCTGESTVYMEYSEDLSALLDPLAERTSSPRSVSLICIALQIMFFICGGSVASLILESFAPEPVRARPGR